MGIGCSALAENYRRHNSARDATDVLVVTKNDGADFQIAAIAG